MVVSGGVSSVGTRIVAGDLSLVTMPVLARPIERGTSAWETIHRSKNGTPRIAVVEAITSITPNRLPEDPLLISS